MRISDWSSDVCSSDLAVVEEVPHVVGAQHVQQALVAGPVGVQRLELEPARAECPARGVGQGADGGRGFLRGVDQLLAQRAEDAVASGQHPDLAGAGLRSEEHTSELQSLMRNSYAVFCLKTKTTK